MAENWAGYVRMQELTAKQNNIQTKLAEKMECWVYLNELAEEINK